LPLQEAGSICPYTTKKAPEIMDMSAFVIDHPELVICGEMVGSEIHMLLITIGR